MIRAFHLKAYVLLDPVSKFSFLTPLITVNFRVSPKNLSEPFSTLTSIGELVIARRVLKNDLLQSFIGSYLQI